MSDNQTTPSIYTQNVTPCQAMELLKYNVSNRRISQDIVNGYADEMLKGRWLLIGDAIQFNTDGELINGQHRLLAVIKSGTTVPFYIMVNCDNKCKGAIDGGHNRNVPDTLKMMYGVDRSRMIASAIKSIDRYVNKRNIRVSVGHAMAQIGFYRDAFDWVVHEIPGTSKFSSSVIIGALVYAFRTDPVGVKEFAKLLHAGANLPQGSPILQCRNAILNQGGCGRREQDKRQTFMLILTCLKRYLSGSASLARIRPSEESIKYFAAAHEVIKHVA